MGSIPVLGMIEGRRRRGRQRMRWLDGITDLMDMSLSKQGVSTEKEGQSFLASSLSHNESNSYLTCHIALPRHDFRTARYLGI